MATRKKVSPYKIEQRTTTVGAAISDAWSALQGLRDEMSETADNMEDALSGTPKYDAVCEARDGLDGVDNEPDVHDSVSDLPVTYGESVNRRKGRSPSRNVQRDNATAMLGAAKDAIDAHAEDLPADAEEKDDLESLSESVQEMIDAADGVEFPGMYG